MIAARWPAAALCLRIAADAILSVTLSPCCVCCDGPLEHPTLGPVCPACWATVTPVSTRCCDVCGCPRPAPSGTSAGGTRDKCADCVQRSSSLARVRSAGLYEGRFREIIHAFKYEGRRSLARRLAGMMRERGADVLHEADAVVPVPLHPRRRRQRGFNQAHDLAARLGLPVIAALRRTRATRSQADLHASERFVNVSGAFAIRRWSQVPAGGTIVLVDDVMTTGATLEACAAALRDAGVREVRALTAARVAPPPR